MSSFVELLKRIYTQEVIDVLVNGSAFERAEMVSYVQKAVRKALAGKEVNDVDSGDCDDVINPASGSSV